MASLLFVTPAALFTCGYDNIAIHLYISENTGSLVWTCCISTIEARTVTQSIQNNGLESQSFIDYSYTEKDRKSSLLPHQSMYGILTQ